MALNEQIVEETRYYRQCVDKENKQWERYGLWNRGKDTECEDGNTVETKVGAIKGITTSTNVSETGYAADAKTVSEIKQSLANGKIKFGIDSSGNYGYIKDGADTVIPFKRYEDGRIQGRNDVIGSPNSYGLYTKAQYDANKVTYKSGNYNTGLNGETWRSTSFNTGFSTIIALQINCWNDEGNGYFNAFKNVRISGGKVSLDFYAADYVNNYVQWLAVGK